MQPVRAKASRRAGSTSNHIQCVNVSVCVHVCVAGELMLVGAADGGGVPRSDTPR